MLAKDSEHVLCRRLFYFLCLFAVCTVRLHSEHQPSVERDLSSSVPLHARAPSLSAYVSAFRIVRFLSEHYFQPGRSPSNQSADRKSSTFFLALFFFLSSRFATLLARFLIIYCDSFEPTNSLSSDRFTQLQFRIECYISKIQLIEYNIYVIYSYGNLK